MAYKQNTICWVIDQIDSKKMFLPAIQRKYVWTEEQITKLMDSIMRGYPFGTFLFWRVNKTSANDKYLMYEFIKDYHERDCFQNMLARPLIIHSEDETILSVLDGQQRLTSLYIALKGSMSLKLSKKRWNNNSAFPKKELYFNLLSGNNVNNNDVKYEFKFLDNNQCNNGSNAIWYKVKDIVQYNDITSLNKMIRTSSWYDNDLATDNITMLFERIMKDNIINYFEVASNSIDDVLDIFVRVNSGGTVLSKTDLLFSTIVSYWPQAREEIDSLLKSINDIGDRYNFTNDFIMRACLYVTDLPISLKVSSFGQINVHKIKNDWQKISEAIFDTIDFMRELGFNSENIIADNAIIPIIYYRYMYGTNAFKNDIDPKAKKIILDEEMEIRKYMVVSQVRHIFGQSTSSALSTIRKEQNKYKGKKFELKDYQNLNFFSGTNLRCNAQDIDSWFDEFEKGPYTFMLLSLLYSYKYGKVNIHQDHMHPFSSFNTNNLKKLKLPNGSLLTNDEIKEWKHKCNTLANLQLLDSSGNQSKNAVPLVKWLQNPTNSANVKYLPQGISYDLNNFEKFIEERKKLMSNDLKKILLYVNLTPKLYISNKKTRKKP